MALEDVAVSGRTAVMQIPIRPPGRLPLRAARPGVPVERGGGRDRHRAVSHPLGSVSRRRRPTAGTCSPAQVPQPLYAKSTAAGRRSPGGSRAFRW